PNPNEIFVPDTEAEILGPERAQAIVAYREQRRITALGDTGDYGNNNGRAWRNGAMFRRGTGFLTVGELANVRHPEVLPVPGPTGNNPHSYFRMDFGQVGLTDAQGKPIEDYVQAVATLVALADWVTVRSDVFTVYGVLRGAEDPSIEDPDPVKQDFLRQRDIDTRAIRFQETIDRLPAFLGEPGVMRLGERVVVPYLDVQND
ncbi:MAG: hypothetical protein D6788_11990, partial [Planctomycetota bacterium]